MYIILFDYRVIHSIIRKERSKTVKKNEKTTLTDTQYQNILIVVKIAHYLNLKNKERIENERQKN